MAPELKRRLHELTPDARFRLLCALAEDYPQAAVLHLERMTPKRDIPVRDWLIHSPRAATEGAVGEAGPSAAMG